MDVPFDTPAERASGLRKGLGRVIDRLRGDWLIWTLGGSTPDVLALAQYRDEEPHVFTDRRRTTLRRL